MSKTVKERIVQPNFITEIIEEDLRAGRYDRIVTRFPPEPNGYAHLGHAIAGYINFGVAHDYGGGCRLRMDDTNPLAERLEYAESLIADMRWLGFHWEGEVSYASNHFEALYRMAVRLIEMGRAYVDSTTPEEMARLRGTPGTPGTPSPFRTRGIKENLALFEQMRAGAFPGGTQVLRARIDLASPNMKLRDPVLYRIVHADHYRTKDTWRIYPSYDFAQATSDALDGVTHSLCSLEFVDNRAVYDWLLDHLWTGPRPHQYEFGRRNLEYTVVSKRKLRKLIESGFVESWDDPRMPTLAGQRRRGVHPAAIRRFASQVGISRTNRTVDIALLEHAIREDLNLRAPRVMGVLQPLKVFIENLPEQRFLQLSYWPHDVIEASPDKQVPLPGGARVEPRFAVRAVPLTREIFIEQDDFSTDPPKGFKRLTPGGAVRLRGAGIIRCEDFEQDASGRVTQLRCSMLDGEAKAKGVVHWVSATEGLPCEFRLYDRLFKVPRPEQEAPERGENAEGANAGEGFLAHLNPDSLRVMHGYIEPSVPADPTGTRYQLERLGYFWPDPKDSRPEALVMNRIVTLRDSWAKAGREGEPKQGSRKKQKNLPSKPKSTPARPGKPVTDDAGLQVLHEMDVERAEAVVLAGDPALLAYFQQAAGEGNAKIISRWVVHELGPAIRRGEMSITPAELAVLARRVEEGKLPKRVAREALALTLSGEGSLLEIIETRGLHQPENPEALKALAKQVLAAHPAETAAYRDGKRTLLGFFVGQVMHRSTDHADPQVVRSLLGELLDT